MCCPFLPSVCNRAVCVCVWCVCVCWCVCVRVLVCVCVCWCLLCGGLCEQEWAFLRIHVYKKCVCARAHTRVLLCLCVCDKVSRNKSPAFNPLEKFLPWTGPRMHICVFLLKLYTHIYIYFYIFLWISFGCKNAAPSREKSHSTPPHGHGHRNHETPDPARGLRQQSFGSSMQCRQLFVDPPAGRMELAPNIILKWQNLPYSLRFPSRS